MTTSKLNFLFPFFGTGFSGTNSFGRALLREILKIDPDEDIFSYFGLLLLSFQIVTLCFSGWPSISDINYRSSSEAFGWKNMGYRRGKPRMDLRIYGPYNVTPCFIDLSSKLLYIRRRRFFAPLVALRDLLMPSPAPPRTLHTDIFTSPWWLEGNCPFRILALPQKSGGSLRRSRREERWKS